MMEYTAEEHAEFKRKGMETRLKDTQKRHQNWDAGGWVDWITQDHGPSRGTHSRNGRYTSTVRTGGRAFKVVRSLR